MTNIEFSGEYKITLDPKKRINIPAAIRKILPAESDGKLVFTRGFEGCVYMFPGIEWKRLTEKLMTLNSFDVKVRNFIRVFVGSAHTIGMDSQGRILLPDSILEMAEIKKDILLQGSLNKYEMWNPEIYQNYLTSNNIKIENLAEQINFSALFKREE
jgi:MraZ protein